MVHGDCSSRGCYAMTDEQISEIFALGRESFFGGQASFQVQAYPFRMTPANMAKHRSNPNMPFWKMLKQGNDHFEVTRMEPKVDVCEKRYVFNASAPDNATPSPRFSPAGKCPAFEVPQDVAAAVHDKQRRDEFQTAQLISRGGPVAPVKSGRDGGMHPTFVAALKPQEIVDEKGNIKLVVDKNPPPGVMQTAAYSSASPVVDPPIAPVDSGTTASITVADVPLPRSRAAGKVRRAPGRTLLRRPAGQVLPAGYVRARGAVPRRGGGTRRPGTADGKAGRRGQSQFLERRTRRRSPRP